MDDLRWAIAREIPHLRRFAYALCDGDTRADDLIQDTLEKAIRKQRLWQRVGSLRSWLFKILYRLYLDQRRSVWSRIVSKALPATEVPLPLPANQEAAVAFNEVGATLQKLPSEQRAAILLVALEGMSYDEAAAALGIPLGTLRSRLSRGRQRLMELWHGQSDAPRLRRVK